MDYLEFWWQDKREQCQKGETIIASEAWGRFRRIVGPKINFAALKLRLEPSEAFEVENQLNVESRTQLDRIGYRHLDYAMLGVLDELLARNICKVKVIVQEIETHPVDSAPIAYRLAAREAVKTILETK